MASFLDLLIFLIPIYIANSIPVVLGGGTPLDLGVNFTDDERLFGDNKTIRGFLAGAFGGSVAGGMIAIIYPLPFFPDQGAQFLAGAVFSFAAISGDAVGSFIKRRLKVPAGKPFLPDTILFLIFALIIGYPFVGPGFYEPFNLIFCIGLTAILHPFTNILANKLGLKRVPW